MSEAPASKPRFPLVLQIITGVLLGALTGFVVGARAAPLQQLGAGVVWLLKALATPLVFFAIVESLTHARLPWKQGVRLLVLCVVNACVAGALALALAAAFRPWRGFNVRLLASADNLAKAQATAEATARALLPRSLFERLLDNSVVVLVVTAVIVGILLRRQLRRGVDPVLPRLVSRGFRLLTRLLALVIHLVPLAVFGVVAAVVGQQGLAPFSALGMLCLTVAVGLVLHVAVYYSALLALLGRRNPIAFFRAAGTALMTALSTGSSMATLPVTLRTLEERLGVSPASARLAACIGTNFNNDGIMLYEVAAALFVAHISGVDLTSAQTLGLLATSAIAAAGIAGVPEAGLITLSLVLTAAHLPVTAVPLLLSVDWMLGRLRAATNVASDLTLATVLDRFDDTRRARAAKPPATYA